MKLKLSVCAIVIVLLVISGPIYGQVRLPRLVSDSMVLQRDARVKVWGWASPGEQVTVNFIGKTYTSVTNSDGKWDVLLSPAKAGGPYNMDIVGKNKITLKGILIGDVWICSGQSNMVIPMERVKYKYPDDIAQCSNNLIREFIIPDKYDLNKPLEDVRNGYWESATPTSILRFSAVGYFFAKSIFEKYHVPIGLIKTCVGGTPIESWMSEDALKEFPEAMKSLDKCRDTAFVNPLMRQGWVANHNWYRTLREKDKGFAPNEKPWFDTSYDDSSWPSMQVPSFWADQGLGMVNGVVWYRKEIEIPASMVGRPAKLWLGRIVDSDSVYVNGKFVGSIGYQYPPRIYDIPSNLLKTGKNLIVVRIISNGGKGGFITDKPYRLDVGQESIDLKGEWKYNLGASMEPLRGSISLLYQPVGLYNGMIAPVINFRIKGVLWYQGESNTNKPAEYQKLLPALISNWRQKWDQGVFPFLYVQLPNFMEVKDQPSESSWAVVREGQLKTLSVPNTAMAVTIDLGEWNDIHPLDKKDVGLRLSLAAQRLAYDDKKIIYSGPIYQSMKIEGNKIVLNFSNIGDGLVAKGGDLKYFAIAGSDKKFVWAKAKIDGNKVIVWNDQIASPVAVSYAWADNPDGANLYNKEGLPASPFRTEQ
jgi:sialate O-acetylesterase